MKTFCRDLSEHTMEIIDCQKIEIVLLTKEEKKSYLKQKICHICKNVFDAEDGKNYQKVRDHCYYTGKCSGAAQRICNLKIQNTKTNSCSNT